MHSNLASSPTTAIMGPTATDHDIEDCEEMDESPSTTQAESSTSLILPTSTHVISTHVENESLSAVTSTASEATARPSSAHTFGLSKLASIKKHVHGHGYPSRQSLNSGQVFTGG